MNFQTLPRWGFPSKFEVGSSGWGNPISEMICKLDQILHVCVQSIGSPLPKTLCAGEQIIDEKGDLFTFTNKFERCVPTCGMTAYNREDNCIYVYGVNGWESILDQVAGKLRLDANAIAAAVNTDPALVYCLTQGNLDPVLPPLAPGFPFFKNLQTGCIFIYDYKSKEWTKLNTVTLDSSGNISLNLIDLNSLVQSISSASGGTQAQSGLLIQADSNGLIDPSWFPSGFGSMSSNSKVEVIEKENLLSETKTKYENLLNDIDLLDELINDLENRRDNIKKEQNLGDKDD